MTREEVELLTDIRDIITLLYMVLRHESSEWLELSRYQESLRHVICNVEP